MGATHQRLLELLGEFGLQRYPTYYAGEGIFHWNGTAHRAGVEHDFGSSLLFFRPEQLGLPAGEEKTLRGNSGGENLELHNSPSGLCPPALYSTAAG